MAEIFSDELINDVIHVLQGVLKRRRERARTAEPQARVVPATPVAPPPPPRSVPVLVPQPVAKDADLEMLTIKEVSKLVKVAPRTIRNLVKENQFPAPQKFGRSVRWRTEAIRAWMEDASRADVESL